MKKELEVKNKPMLSNRKLNLLMINNCKFENDYQLDAKQGKSIKDNASLKINVKQIKAKKLMKKSDFEHILDHSKKAKGTTQVNKFMTVRNSSL